MGEKGPTAVSAKQAAMSRALGAAFLSHQVEQLEKSVGAARAGAGVVSGGGWRDRSTRGALGQGQGHQQQGRGSYASRVQPSLPSQGAASPPQSRAQVASSLPRSAPAAVGASRASGEKKPAGKGRVPSPSASTVSRRRSSDEEREHGWREGKDADVVVVDASVLIHALYQVKRWCKDGREEVVIVPLEALNTLDLLKKGTSSLAQRARAASRILEAQVGTNPRIRVQRDDAFVYWDKIDFNLGTNSPQSAASPEWVRRTICCAKWETDNPSITLGEELNESKPPRVVFAVLSSSNSTSSPGSSPQARTLGLETSSDLGCNTPIVPLPAPLPANKFEPRSAGTLVAQWAAKAGMDVLEIEASAPGHGRIGLGDNEDRDDPQHARGGAGAGKKGGAYHGHGHHGGRRKGSLGSGTASGPGAHSHANTHPNANNGGLVERPPAVMAMMEMVSQSPSSKGKAIRVLARGEKLDP